MTKYEKDILNALLDKYERSKSFTGNSKVARKIKVKILEMFPEYEDEAEYELFTEVNDAVVQLAEKGYIYPKENKNDMITYLELNVNAMENIYSVLSRVPKGQINNQIMQLLHYYESKSQILYAYCDTQKKRLSENKKVEFFDGDISEYENILKSVAAIINVAEETYIRDFSVKVLNDSKAFDRIKNKVAKLLFRYGDYPNEDTILEDLNIIKNPGHVYFKGCGSITISGQTIDLSALNGDIAVSSVLLNSIEEIRVTGENVITIENLTTFNDFSDPGALVIYLGGYHNSHRRNFIRKIYEQNANKRYLHYGDIDAGGFYILLHLRRKTGVPFEAYHMDIETLKRYSKNTRMLTENDRKRLIALIDSEFSNTVNYMLENNCKLEQEAENNSFSYKQLD